MKIQAINNYCTLDFIPPPNEIKRGVILIPETNTATPRWAYVTSVGDGVPDLYGMFRKPDVEEGQLVYVAAHGQYSVHENASDERENVAAASVLDLLVILKNMETLEIQPLGSYIEIEKIELEDANEFGIEVPDSRKAPTNLGIVKSLGLGWTGPDGAPIPMQVKVGEKIVYSPLRTIVVDFSSMGKDEKKYLIQHGDIIGKVKESE
jgi:chaperonin GroES